MFFGLIHLLDRFDVAKMPFDVGLLVVDLEKWQAMFGVGLRGNRCFWRCHAGDSLKKGRVEDLDVEADGVLTLPY